MNNLKLRNAKTGAVINVKLVQTALAKGGEAVIRRMRRQAIHNAILKSYYRIGTHQQLSEAEKFLAAKRESLADQVKQKFLEIARMEQA